MTAHRIAPLLLLAALACYAPRAQAAESCVVTTLGLAFGVYDPTSAAPLNGQGNMTVQCSGNPLTVTMSLSTGASGSYASRRMTNGTDAMYYNLYLDAGRTIVFGDGSGGSQVSACTTGVSSNGCTGSNPGGAGRQFVRPIHGQINASQDVGVGSYSDTIFYTLTF